MTKSEGLQNRLELRRQSLLNALDNAFQNLLRAHSSDPSGSNPPSLANRQDLEDELSSIEGWDFKNAAERLSQAYNKGADIDLEAAVEFWFARKEPEQYSKALSAIRTALTTDTFNVSKSLSSVLSELNRQETAIAAQVKHLRFSMEAVHRADAIAATMQSIRKVQYSNPGQIILVTVGLVVLSAVLVYVLRFIGEPEGAIAPTISESIAADADKVVEAFKAPSLIEKTTAVLAALKDLFSVIPALVGAAGATFAVFRKMSFGKR